MEPIVNDPGTDTSAGASTQVDSTPVTTDPSGQNGSPAPQDGETVKALREQLRATQQQLVDGRQSGNQPGNQTPGLDTPEGQYAVALEIAGARLSNALESIYSLYPEIPADEIARVRANPWAFVSDRNLFLSADWEKAKWQVESSLSKRADEINASKAPAAPAVNPATISNNPAPEVAGEPAMPGTAEDQDPWTMPMDQLEKVAMKEKAKLSSPK